MNLALVLALSTTPAVLQPELPPILPKPVSMHRGSGGAFEVKRDTVIIDPTKTTASGLLNTFFARGAGFKLKSASHAGPAGSIQFIKAPKGALTEGEYKINSGHNGIKVWFADKGGAVYAVQTIRQLLPVEIEGPKPSHTKWTVPAIEIQDSPRFSWRGMHLDVSRHFFQPSFIEKYIDYISMMKMNVFHWHLVDDGGWRLEIKKYPKLTSIGAWRYGITTNWDQSQLRFDPSSGLPKYGGFYTQAQVREIVKYAADRNVNVVPEIEMPGHTMPVFAAYPDMMCQNQPESKLTGQPASNVYCVGNEKTFTFIQDVLDEVMQLFPSKWIHVGGDEVDKEFWHRCPLCQAKMQAEGLKNEEELQSYFIQRIEKYLASKGRRLIGWDEILEGGLAKGATVMSWRGMDGGIAAAKSGHDVVMSPGSHAYFDAPYAGQSTEHVYTFEPVPPSLNALEAKHVLGGQANVWTEWIPTEARAEYMIFPRVTAMSEVLWSPTKGRDINEFLPRMSSIFPRLDRLNTSYYLPAPRVATTAVLFRKKAKVEAIVDRAMPGKLRYTLDGSVPTAKSAAYAHPITISRPSNIKFAYVTAAGKNGEIAGVDCRPAVPEKVINPRHGWSAAYYEGTWNKVPNFKTIKPVGTATLHQLGLGLRKRDENFAVNLKGYFKADKDGVYDFGLSSDDGSWLKVGGALAVDNDGPHGNSEKNGKIWLPKGWHKIEVGFYQGSGAFALTIEVKAPNSKVAKSSDNFVYIEAH